MKNNRSIILGLLQASLILTLFSIAKRVNAQTFEYIDANTKSSESFTLTSVGSNYFVGGRFEPENWFYSVPYLIKFNSAGDTLFTKILESNREAEDQIVKLAPAGSNHIGALIQADKKLKLSLIDSQGIEAWSYTSDLIEHPVALIATGKNGLVACGSCDSNDYNDGEDAVCIIKLNEKGDVIWSIFAGEGERVKPYGLTSTSSGDMILVVKRRVERDYEPYLVLINESGEVSGNISLTNIDIDEVFEIITDKEGSIFLTGEGKSQATPVLVKLSSSGQMEWQQLYEGTTENYRAYSVALDADGGFVLAGRTNDAKGFLIKTDASGNQQWIKTYSGIEKAGFKQVLVSDNGYTLAGVSLTGNKNRVFVLKVNRNGEL